MSRTKQLLVFAGLDKSHWGKIIIDSEIEGGFNELANDQAGEWTTCACGKLDDGIARSITGCPVDRELKDLGEKFDDLIYADAFEAAAVCLIAIEQRAIEVLWEQAHVNN